MSNQSEISLKEYFLENSNNIVDPINNSLIVIDNCRNSLDFIKDLKFDDKGVYQFNSEKARFQMKVDMLYSDPTTTTIDNNSAIYDVTNDPRISRNEDFIITSFSNDIHIVTNEDNKTQFWGDVVINDNLITYNDASFNSIVDISKLSFGKLIVNNDDTGINSSNLKFLKIDTTTNNVVTGDASFGDIINSLNPVVNNINTTAGLELSSNNITISNELIVTSDTSFNSNVTISNELIVKKDIKIHNRLLFFS